MHVVVRRLQRNDADGRPGVDLRVQADGKSFPLRAILVTMPDTGAAAVAEDALVSALARAGAQAVRMHGIFDQGAVRLPEDPMQLEARHVMRYVKEAFVGDHETVLAFDSNVF